MVIHRVQEGETVPGIARRYGISPLLLAELNDISPEKAPPPGLTLVIRSPGTSCTVKPGDTLLSLAGRHRLTTAALYRMNPALFDCDALYPGQTLTLSFRDSPREGIRVNGFFSHRAEEGALARVLPYLTYLTVCGCRFRADGTLLPPEASQTVAAARASGVMPLLQFTSAGEEGTREEEARVVWLLQDREHADRVGNALLRYAKSAGYGGILLDLSFLPAAYSEAYTAFLMRLRRAGAGHGLSVFCTLAATESATEESTCPGQDPATIGRAAHGVVLGTHDLASRYASPTPLCPYDRLERICDSLCKRVRPKKITLALPTVAIDRPVCFREGRDCGVPLPEGELLPRLVQGETGWDPLARSPYLTDRDAGGGERIVWFEDCASLAEKCALAARYGIGALALIPADGVGRRLLSVLDASFQILRPYE